MERIFVTGIGTGVGKTIASAILVEALQADYWKPVQAGEPDDTDTRKVEKLVSNSKSYFHPEAYVLQKPASPHDAAMEENVFIFPEKIKLPSTTNNIIIEGAGGLMVPMNDNFLIIDLIKQLDAVVVLVSENYLGSINHTLMSYELLKSRNIPVKGIIFNGKSYKKGEDFILKFTGYKKLLQIKQEKIIDKKIIHAYSTELLRNWDKGYLNRGSISAAGYNSGFLPIESEGGLHMDLAEKDMEIIWHPFTQMYKARPPIPVIRGEKALLYDDKGNAYIDAVSSWWVNLHGHAHPYIATKVADQLHTLEHVIFAGFTHPPAVHLATGLLAMLPSNQKRVFYSDNGSTAVEVALKMAIQYWYNQGKPRKKILAFRNSYHGDTFGAMSVSERDAFTKPFHTFLFETIFIDVPVPGNENESMRQFREAAEGGDIAAFVYEPLVLGTAGMLMYEPWVLDSMLCVCREENIPAIADEVMTGFGRTGKLFASDYCENKPDIICLSKGLTGGTMALGITTCTSVIYDAFLSDDKLKTFFHGHSFTANPVACTAALASIQLLMKEETRVDINRISASFHDFSLEIKAHPKVSEVRHKGSILAIVIDTGNSTSYFNSIRDLAYDFFINRKILLRPLGNVIYILPPYCISNHQLKEIYTAIKDFLYMLQNND